MKRTLHLTTRAGGGAGPLIDGTAVEHARCLVAGRPVLPLPGRGETVARWQFLADVAGRDLSVGRLVEGHGDALAIVAELDSERVVPDGLLGVWAARPAELSASREADGWVLDGVKPFCSGSNQLDHALVTATADDGPRLFAVDAGRVQPSPGSWTPLGMAATVSDTVVFDHVTLDASAAVGGPGAYVDRPGFGHGGCGVAACWWGGANRLLADLADALADREDDRSLAAYGRAAMAVEAARLVLVAAASAIDAAPTYVEVAQRSAAVTRSASAAAARTVLAAAERHLGTGVLGADAAVAGRVADLTMYLTQYHDQAGVDLGRRLLHEERRPLC